MEYKCKTGGRMVYIDSRATLLTALFSLRCSDGIDRHRQEWFQSGCLNSVSLRLSPPVCSDPVHDCCVKVRNPWCTARAYNLASISPFVVLNSTKIISRQCHCMCLYSNSCRLSQHVSRPLPPPSPPPPLLSSSVNRPSACSDVC